MKDFNIAQLNAELNEFNGETRVVGTITFLKWEGATKTLTNGSGVEIDERRFKASFVDAEGVIRETSAKARGKALNNIQEAETGDVIFTGLENVNGRVYFNAISFSGSSAIDADELGLDNLFAQVGETATTMDEATPPL